VFFFLETVLGNEKPADAGELPGGGHGATEPVPNSGRMWVTRKATNRSTEDQRPGLKRTLSLQFFVKSP
jgi:hypothetical protein